MPATFSKSFACLLSSCSTLIIMLLTSCVNNTQPWIPQQNEANYQWMAIPEAGYAFNRIHIDDKGNTYVLSTGDVIMFRARGKSWVKENCPVADARFRSIAGYGEAVWIAGDKGLLLYKKNSNSPWIQEKKDTLSASLLALYASDKGVWAAGQQGKLFYRTAKGDWIKENTPLKEGGFSKIYLYNQQLWLTGTHGTILHRTTDGSWIQDLLPDQRLQARELYCFKDDLWLIANDNTLLHKKGNSQWTIEQQLEHDADLYELYGYQQEVWVFGSKGLILHREADGQWKKEESNAGETYLFTVYGHEKEIWATGNTSIIVHRNAKGIWEKQESHLRGTPLFALQGYNNELYATGMCETILYKKGNNPWKTEPATISEVPLTGMFAWDNDIWITTNSGTFLHKKQQGAWLPEQTPVQGIKFKAIYGYKGDTWLIGSGNTILHRTKDARWIKEEADVNYFEPEDIYGKDGSIWIAGNRGTLLHKKVTDARWKKEDINALDVYFINIFGQGDDIWVTGSNGTILHKKGNGDWEKEKNIAANLVLHDMEARGDTLLVVGDNGTVLQKQGNGDWKREKGIASDIHLDNICLLGNETWLISKSGILLHRSGNGKWESDKYDAANLQNPVLYKGFFIPAHKGFLYKENDRKNLVHVVKTGDLSGITAAAVMNDELYCINGHAIFRMKLSDKEHPTVSDVKYSLLSPLQPDKMKLEYKMVLSDKPAEYPIPNIVLSVSAKPYGEAPGVNDFFTDVIDSNTHMLEKLPNGVRARSIFEIGKSFRIVPGWQSANKLSVRVNVASGDSSTIESFVLKDEEGHAYLTLKNDFWSENKIWIVPVLAILLYYLCWIITWQLYPLLFLKIYFSGFFKQLTDLQLPLLKYLPLTNVLLPVKKLVQTNHTLDAWIRMNKPLLGDKFGNSETASFRNHYVALPLRIEDAITGKLVDKPDEQLIKTLFADKQNTIQVIGPGGTGKTTLALAMGRWLLQGTSSSHKRTAVRIPVLVEADTTDLLQTVTELLTAWLNTDNIKPEFTRMLVKRQKLVIIADALSERSPATQEYFSRMHGNLPVNALIITTRHKVKLQVDSRDLYPAALNSENLVHFVTSILATYNSQPLKAHEQLEFAGKIVSLTENSSQQAVTPILVKLMIENAMKDYAGAGYDFNRMMLRMPASVPEVYFQYLSKVNPGNTVASNYLPDDIMLQLAALLSLLSLGSSLIPRDFTKQLAAEAITQHFPELKHIDPIQRFIDNGILTQRKDLLEYYLRFNLDSMAEYIGATKLYDEHAVDEPMLADFKAHINSLGSQAAGFSVAFEQVIAYKRRHHLHDKIELH